MKIKVDPVAVKLYSIMARGLPDAWAKGSHARQVQVDLFNSTRQACQDKRSREAEIRIITTRSADNESMLESSAHENVNGFAEQDFQAILLQSFNRLTAAGLVKGLTVGRDLVGIHDGKLWVGTLEGSVPSFHFIPPIYR